MPSRLERYPGALAPGIPSAEDCSIVPGINYVYNILPPMCEVWQINLMALSCVLTGGFMHLLGHYVLGGLK